MNRTLPPAIVAGLEALGTDLASWAQAHRDSTLAEQEAAVLSRVRVALPQLLSAVLTVSTRKLDPGLRRTPERCPRCAGRCRVQSWRRRRMTTVCGRAEWERPWYVCGAVGRAGARSMRRWRSPPGPGSARGLRSGSPG